MDKKGIELSINFIVIIVIAVIVFFFGVRFIYNLASQAMEIEKLTSDELDARIGSLLCEGSEKVCLGIDRKVIKRGNFDVFGLKIINIVNSQNFDIIVNRPSPGGYTKEGIPIQNDNLIWNPKTRSAFLKRNEEKEFGIGIEVPKDAKSGIYIFDVKVMPYDSLHKIYVEVP